DHNGGPRRTQGKFGAVLQRRTGEMMEQAIDILSWALLLGGSFFLLVGAIGVLRLPDLYTRSHAAGITDTMGAILILLGLMLQGGFTLITAKLLMKQNAESDGKD
ncbi:MAG: cation:proton antiporter, partial [Alphaproteobacteria bacterium]